MKRCGLKVIFSPVDKIEVMSSRSSPASQKYAAGMLQIVASDVATLVFL